MENDDFTKWKCCHINGDSNLFLDDDKDKIFEYLRSIKVQEESLEYFYTRGLGVNREMEQERVYGVVEKYINDRFKVLHCYRDIRGDNFDDGGYIVMVSIKDDWYYLHIFYVSYNCNMHIICCEDDFKKFKYDKDYYSDFKKFKHLYEVQEEVNKFVGYVETILTTKNDKWFDVMDDECLQYVENVLNIEFSKLEVDWLYALTNPYNNLEKDWYFLKYDKPNLLKLTTLQYVPNFKNNVYED